MPRLFSLSFRCFSPRLLCVLHLACQFSLLLTVLVLCALLALPIQSEEELALKNKRGDAHFLTGRPIQVVPNGTLEVLNTHIIR